MSNAQPLILAATPTASQAITEVVKDNVLKSTFVINLSQIGQFYLSTELFRFMHGYFGERLPNVLDFMFRARVKTLHIPSSDSTYTWVTIWMVNRSEWKQQDTFEVTDDPPIRHGKGKLGLFSYRPSDGVELPDEKLAVAKAYFNPATGNEYKFTFENRNLTIVREGDENMANNTTSRSIYHVKISNADAGVTERFIESAREEYQKQRDDRIEIFIAGRMAHHWGFLCFGDRRDLDTIHLADGIKEKIVGKVDKFLTKRSDYRAQQISHHLGFCLYGPPGTGKTTLIRAIASHFKLKIHILNLSSGDLNDPRLHMLVSSMREGGILLIEDIDKQLDPETSKITAAGLLQALEGSANPVAHIVFVTANSLEPLKEHEDTIFRHGRIDIKIRLGYADKGMAKSLFRKFFSTRGLVETEKIDALSERFAEGLQEDTWSMAHLEGYLLEHDSDIEGAVEEFAEWQSKQKEEKVKSSD